MKKVIKSLDLVKARSGQLTATVTVVDGQTHFLHSTYDPEKEARDWLKAVELKPDNVYIVLGFGLGYHIKALLEVLPTNTHIFVIEYSREESLLAASRQIFSRPKWMFDARMDCLVTEDIRDMAATINKTMQKMEIKSITLCRHFPTMQIYNEFYEKIEQQLVSKAADLFNIDYNYRLSAGDVVIKNAWGNLTEIFFSKGIAHLKDMFKGRPAIMVAGGPSLNKNIHLLKEYADHAVIICAGSTMGALHHHGIKPHFLLAVDPFHGMEQDLEGVVNEDTYLVASYIIADTLVGKYPGKKLFFLLGENSPNINVLSGIKEYLPPTSVLHANISVAMTSTNFAVHLGCDPVILVGQDLSFGQDLVSHAEGSKAQSWIDKSVGYENYISVPGYYGDIVKTTPNFKEAIDWYISYFDMMKDCTFINATEGGAYLPGAEHISLQEVAERYLVKKVDAFTAIQEADQECMSYDHVKLCAYLHECIEELGKLKRQGASVLQETDNCPAHISAGDVNSAKEDLNKLASYTETVRNSPIYIHLMPYLHALMELFTFKQQDGYDDLEEQFLNYVALYMHVQGAVNEVYKIVMDATSNLEHQIQLQQRKGE